MSDKTTASSLYDFEFLEIHSLATKFSHPHTPHHEKRLLAEKALLLMDKYRALHPKHQQMCTFVDSPIYGEEWIIAIKDHTTTTMLNDDEQVFDEDKEKTLSKVAPLIKACFIRADFHMLEYYFNKLTLSALFSSNVFNEESYVKNRYFEFLFFQMACVLYGQYWFHELIPGESIEKATSGDSNNETLNLALIEKKADAYYEGCEKIPDFSMEKAGPECSELDFYWALKWFCAFIEFKENRFNGFVESFQKLKNKLLVLEKLNIHEEAIVSYAIARVCTRPFKDLNSNAEEDLLDMYTSDLLTSIHNLLDQLLMGNFVDAKGLYSSEFVQKIDSHMAHTVPTKSVGSFWDSLEVIIDLKVFLLVMSLAKYIPRTKLLEKMGYANALHSVQESVSNNMVLLISVLGLGKTNIYYHQAEDRFCNLPIHKELQLLELKEQLAKVDHTIKAEATATQMRGLLVSKFFRDLRDAED